MKNRPYRATEIYFDPSTSNLLYNWEWDDLPDFSAIPLKYFPYRNERLFSAHVTGKCVRLVGSMSLETPILRLTLARLRKTGCKVEDVYFCLNNGQRDPQVPRWIKMTRASFGFSAPLETLYSNHRYSISFCLKIASAVDNYHYEMMDATWATQLWSAAINRQLTDVEILVGSNKLEAHRVVLSSRSAILEALLSGNTQTITIEADVDFPVVEQFLKFLYTGKLDFPAENEQLLVLADIYEVITLKKLCQLACRAPPSVAEVTSSLFAAL